MFGPLTLVLVDRRIRSLEAHVAEIKVTQSNILNTLSELVAQIRGGSIVRSPPYGHYQSPSLGSPPTSTPTPTVSHQHINDIHQSSPITSSGFPGSSTSVRPHRTSVSFQPSAFQPNQATPSGETQSSVTPQPYVNSQGYNQSQPPRMNQGHSLPPFSSIQAMGAPSAQSNNVSSIRFQAPSNTHLQRQSLKHSGLKRPLSSSHLTSGESSDFDDEENGELPAHGLVAPWEVLRGLADVASRRAAKVPIDEMYPYFFDFRDP